MTVSNPFAVAAASSVDLLCGLASQALQGVERLAALNVQTVKTLLAESQAHVEAALSATSLEELRELHASVLRTGPQKAAAYGGHVREILAALAVAPVSAVSHAVGAPHQGETIVDASGQVSAAMAANTADVGDAAQGSEREAIAA